MIPVFTCVSFMGQWWNVHFHDGSVVLMMSSSVHWQWKRLDWNIQFISALFSVGASRPVERVKALSEGQSFQQWATNEVTVPSRTLKIKTIRKNGKI